MGARGTAVGVRGYQERWVEQGPSERGAAERGFGGRDERERESEVKRAGSLYISDVTYLGDLLGLI